MKASNINGRIDKAGKHNDRNFDVSRASHIDPEKTKENKYWVYTGKDDRTFNQIELAFYKEHFSDHLKAQNRVYRERRQKGRMKDAEYYRSSERTRPEDKILQIGNVEEHVSGEELWACALEYQKRFNERYGRNCMILDMALHMDEATPHVHVRRVWIGHDRDGNECVGQEKALTELGVMPPDTERPTGRYNNRKMTFTYEDQEMFREIARERGIEIEEPTHKKQRHLTPVQYQKQRHFLEDDIEHKRETIKELDEETEKKKSAVAGLKKDVEEICDLFEDLLLDPMFNGEYEEKVRKARQKEADERAKILSKLFITEAAAKIPQLTRIPDSELRKEKRDIKKKLKAAEKVIKGHHLEKEYSREKKAGRGIVL